MLIFYRNTILNMDNVIRLRADYDNLVADCVDGKTKLIAQYEKEQTMENALMTVCTGVHNGAKYITLPDEREGD